MFLPQTPQFYAYPISSPCRCHLTWLHFYFNYPPLYSSSAIRRSSVDRCSASPAPPNTSSWPPCATASVHSLTIFSHDVPDKSTFTSLLSLSGPSNLIHREAGCTAALVLCNDMLRPSQGVSLGVCESEEVGCRAHALARLVCV